MMNALRIQIPRAKSSNMYVSPSPNVSLGGISVTPSPTGTSLLTPSPMGKLNNIIRNAPANVNERVSFAPLQPRIRIRRGGTKKRKNKSKSKSRKNHK